MPGPMQLSAEYDACQESLKMSVAVHAIFPAIETLHNDISIDDREKLTSGLSGTQRHILRQALAIAEGSKDQGLIQEHEVEVLQLDIFYLVKRAVVNRQLRRGSDEKPTNRFTVDRNEMHRELLNILKADDRLKPYHKRAAQTTQPSVAEKELQIAGAEAAAASKAEEKKIRRKLRAEMEKEFQEKAEETVAAAVAEALAKLDKEKAKAEK